MVERVKKIAENSKEVIRHIRSKYVKVLNSYKDEESEDAIFEYTNKVRLGISAQIYRCKSNTCTVNHPLFYPKRLKTYP